MGKIFQQQQKHTTQTQQQLLLYIFFTMSDNNKGIMESAKDTVADAYEGAKDMANDAYNKVAGKSEYADKRAQTENNAKDVKDTLKDAKDKTVGEDVSGSADKQWEKTKEGAKGVKDGVKNQFA